MTHLRTTSGLGLAALLLSATAANATPTFTPTVTYTTNSTLASAFLPGDGNSNTHFAIATIEEDFDFDGFVENWQLGLKAKQRFFGDTLPISGSVYEAQPGFSPVSGSDPTLDPTRAWWNWDWSIDLGQLRTFNDTNVTMTIRDIENDVYSVNFSPSLFPALNGQHLAQDSWNTGFAFLQPNLNGFNPFTPGDYRINLSATDVASGTALASLNIVVRVVPAPASAGLLGLGGLLAARRRR